MIQILTPLNIIVPLGLTVIILVTIFFILYYQNREIYKKIVFEKVKFEMYRNAIKKLKDNPSSERTDFEDISLIARSFFKEYLNLSYSLTYLELGVYFKKQRKDDFARFCSQMSELNYSGKDIARSDINTLIDMLNRLVDIADPKK